HDILGYNFRMMDLSAAIGLVQLGRLPGFNAKRRHNAAFLSERLTSVVTPTTHPRAEHVWHQYTVRFTESDRDEAIKKLAEAGVGYGVF
ncbi:aminotransferase DegT, partial [Pseudomonas sp. GW460-R15]|uniref:DegT/DnrJ/EryC1/StrS family aminotransferase n=1 Tax=Pseudomonas sp. GW460-R15 TaxID=2075557 RepID=UPI000CD39A62